MQKKRLTIGILIGMLDESYQARIWPGFEEAAKEMDINIIFFVGRALCSPYGYDIQHHIIYDLISKENIDGLIIITGTMGQHSSTQILKNFCNKYKNIPVVGIAQKVEGLTTILVDNKKGMYELVDHLINVHKYKNIAFIKGPEDHQEADERYETYLKALKDNNIPFNPDLVTPGDFVMDKGVDAIKLLLDIRKVKFDAIISANDDMALGAFKALNERGYVIPKDIALAGFDDIDVVKVFNPTLTSVRQPLKEISRKSLEIILMKINKIEAPEKICLPAKLQIRQSCGCISNSIINDKSVKHKQSEKMENFNILFDTDVILNQTLKTFNILSESKQKLNSWLKQLLNEIIEIIKTKKNHESFIHLIIGFQIHEIEIGGDEKKWEKLFIELKKNILKYLKNEDDILKIESLFQKAIVLIDEILVRPDAFNIIQVRHRKWILREISQTLITTFELSQLMDTVASELPRLDINSCYISLYQGEVKQLSTIKWKIPKKSKLILAFNKNGRFSLKDSNLDFNSTNLIPSGILPQDQRYTMITMPLFFRDEHFGFIIFELGSTVETIYETLRGQISSALKGALLFKEQRETEELRIAKEAAETANELKSEFLANMSHEIRTPMNSILGFSSIMLEEEKDNEKKKRLKIIMKAGNNLLDLINDILDFSKIEADKIEFKEEKISLKKLLNDIYNMFLIHADQSKIKFKVNVDKNIPEYIISDERRINQIIINLVSNAFKFTKKGSIEINCKKIHNSVRINVKDTGIGIPKDKKNIIFSPFSQVDASSTREYGGTGLGLAISKSIIQKLKGKIYFKTEINKGTTFTIELPLEQNVLNKNKNIKINPHEPERILQKWLEKAENDKEIENIIIKFLNVIPSRINELEKMIMKKNNKKIKKIAHDLKGVSGNLELNEIYELFRNIDNEINKKSPDFNKIKKSVKEIKNIISLLPIIEISNIESIKNINPEDFNVLVAEDNELNRELIKVLLDKLNVKYEFAENGKIALEKLEKNINDNMFDLLLLDMQMPIMDGHEVIKQIRNDKSIKKIYVIALTAHALKGDHDKYINAGCNDYISKPIDKKIFKLKLIELIKQKTKLKKQNKANKKNIKHKKLSQNQKELLNEVISGLVNNSKIFNQDEVVRLSNKLVKISDDKILTDIKKRLDLAAEEFDDEEIVKIIDLLKKL